MAVPLSPVTMSAPLPVTILSLLTPPNTTLLPLPASMMSSLPVAAMVSVVCALLTIDEPVKKSICALSPAIVSLPAPVEEQVGAKPADDHVVPVAHVKDVVAAKGELGAFEGDRVAGAVEIE